MAKNVDPRYTNAIKWTGGTIDTATTTFTITANTSDHRANWIIATNNTSSGIQTMSIAFTNTADATMSSHEVAIPANSGVSGTSTFDVLGAMSLPVDSAGNNVLHIPTGYSIVFTISAAESNTLDVMAELGDFNED